MASVLITTGVAENRVEPPADGSGRHATANVPLFHFGLRQLLSFVTVICALLAAVASTQGFTALVLVLTATIVAMHVFATAIGTRLRSQTDEEQLRNAAGPMGSASGSLATARSAKLAEIRCAPRSPWHGRRSTYLPWLPQLIVAAMIFGGIVGALLLSGAIGHRTSAAGVVVGAVSFAVLAGWVSFLCGNFYGVFRHGFREALAEQQKDEPGTPS